MAKTPTILGSGWSPWRPASTTRASQICDLGQPGGLNSLLAGVGELENELVTLHVSRSEPRRR